jgi:hypothetical protein
MCFFAHCEEELRHPDVEACVPQDVLEAMAAEKAAEAVQRALQGMKDAAGAKSQVCCCRCEKQASQRWSHACPVIAGQGQGPLGLTQVLLGRTML